MRKEAFFGGAALAVSSVLWYFWKRNTPRASLQAPIQAEIDPILRMNPVGETQVFPQLKQFQPIPTIAAPKQMRMPYNEPHFGSDKERNADDEIRLDDYLNLPLEGSGKTHTTKNLYVDLDEEVPVEKDQFTFFRLKVLKTRDGTAPTVAIGGFIFLLGSDVVYHPKTQIWNPHTGERSTFYPEAAWSDSDQKELIVKFPFPVSIDAYKIRTSEQDIGFDPVEWRLEGSLNGVYWLPLDEREVPVPTVRGVWMRFDCD